MSEFEVDLVCAPIRAGYVSEVKEETEFVPFRIWCFLPLSLIRSTRSERGSMQSHLMFQNGH